MPWFNTKHYEMAFEVLTLVLMIGSLVIYCSAWSWAFFTLLPTLNDTTVEIMNL